MPPKVSICIPVYNRRDMLRATLWSVLRQTYRDFEVIVSDNASDEDIAGEVLATGDSRARCVRQPANLGSAANFCFLQSQATGEYVLFLCSDDLLMPQCLQKAVTALDSHHERGAALYMAAHYSEEGFAFFSNMPDRDYATAPEYLHDHAVREFRFASPSLCIYRRTVFERLGGWNRSLLAVIDWEMYSRMVRYGGGVIYLHEALAIMRLHDDRESNTAALHWDFYHDVMLLAAQPEHDWDGAYRAMAVVDQLLWDWRLKRSPRRTIAHAQRTKALPVVVLYLPWEILRRVRLKLRSFLGRAPCGPVAPSPSSFVLVGELASLDEFWRASEKVRAGGTLPSPRTCSPAHPY
jgi:glycosyltransferase involved in cell wall biosynthesis